MKIIVRKQSSLGHNTSQSRRRLLSYGASLSGTGLIPGAVNLALAQGANIEANLLNPTTAVFSGAGSNVLVTKAPNGELLIVDGGLAENSVSLLQSIESTLDSNAINILFNTHWHPEQTGLNESLGSLAIPIFAHDSTRQWLGSSITWPWNGAQFEPLPVTARPSDTFFHYGDMDRAGVAVQYGYLRQAHTDGDMYIFFPEENVLHTGGAINSDSWPVVDWWTGGWIGGLVDGIETLLSLANDQTIIVPANGPVINKARLETIRDMYADIFEKVRSQFMAAQTAAETIASKPAGEYENDYGNSDQFILLCHQSVLAHYAPDA